MILNRELGSTIMAILIMVAFIIATSSCGYIHIGKDPLPEQPEQQIDQMQVLMMNAAGQMIMAHLKMDQPEWADIVVAYVHNTLLPKLDDPNAETIIRLKDEIVYGLHRILDNVTMEENWKIQIRIAINLLADVFDPSVKINYQQKALLKAFADGLIQGYETL